MSFLLLFINLGMILFPGVFGIENEASASRFSFLTVGIWWAGFAQITFNRLPEMGIQPQLLEVIRQREIETQLGNVAMNCEMCKFRLAALDNNTHSHGHHHHGGHHHHHEHNVDPYAKPDDYHQRIWQTP